MAGSVIPVQPVPYQTLNVVLNGTFIRLDLYERSTGLYLNLYLNDVLVVAGAICQNQNPILHAPYLGLGGDLFFMDLQGSDDPLSSGLGTRFILIFAEGI